MVYSNKVVACVKVGGKVLRESGNVVTLPFGSEYSLLIKNLHSVRIQARVSVDGQDATEGTWLIVGPNQSLELERFIKNGNLTKGNRFKFIERTSEIEEHRGIKEDDGLIRIEYQVERSTVTVPRVNYEDYWVPRPYWPRPTWPRRRRADDWQPWCGYVTNDCSFQASLSQGVSVGSLTRSANLNDAGITVPGSESNQQFHWASGFETCKETEVIVLQLRGQVGARAVTQPVTVDTKTKCQTCGKVDKRGNQYCGRCGTALVIY